MMRSLFDLPGIKYTYDGNICTSQRDVGFGVYLLCVLLQLNPRLPRGATSEANTGEMFPKKKKVRGICKTYVHQDTNACL